MTDAFNLLSNLRPGSPSRFFARLLLFTLPILLSAAIAVPFFYSHPDVPGQGEIRQTKDMGIHLSVMRQFDKVLKSGSVYPRWLPDVNYGYGNAWPNFYQPGFYYLTSLVHAITDSWVDTLFVITALGLFASGLAFYILARAFFGKMASVVAATVYVLLPYHLFDVFWRGAMPEYLTFVLLPLILYFFYRLGSKGDARFYAGLGVCYGSCLMIHIPIAYLLSYVLILYALVWAIAQRDWRIVARIGLGMSIGVLLSAIYWMPAVTEIKYAVETVTTLFRYDSNYITQLSSEDSYGQMLKVIFVIQSVALLSVGAVLWFKRRESRRSHPAQAPGTRTTFSHESMWIALGALSIFMNLPVSYYVARLIPRINVVAFPYRWLVFVCLFTSLLTAALVERVASRVGEPRKTWMTSRAAFAISMTVLALNIWFSAQAVTMASLSSPMITREMNFLCDTYCPLGAPPAGQLPLTERIAIESTSGTYELVEWSALRRSIVITSDEPTAVRFKTFNFPGWTARLDGADTRILSDPVEAQVIEVPQGTHTLEINFGGTPARYLGAATSVAGVVLVCIVMLGGRLRLGRQRHNVREGNADDEKTSRESV